ncbi:2-oxoglutarate and iron-dependent oxygenase domain-containing protein 3 [Tyto alba]|uniref:2-oxoglutarate and iron-dependent oxygenase domain-containing protein 3 n=1 Tax=Tyto alba TaxID=56313 RepID=UPI001C669EB6|nr:2-oxoglutarate and iron-dependent oxygenase domain-containing protein 3 [Tyto alba]
MPPRRPRLLPAAWARLGASIALACRRDSDIKRLAASFYFDVVPPLFPPTRLVSVLISPPPPVSVLPRCSRFSSGIFPPAGLQRFFSAADCFPLAGGRGASRAHRSVPRGAMAAQRRAAPRGPESGGTAAGPGRGGRRHSGARKSRAQQESRWRWLKTAFLLLSAAGGGLLSWSCLSAEDGVTEVLAGRSENLRGKFIEIPCSEDYDSHKRFEGCTPRKCGRGVTDAVITREEAERIRRIAERGLSLGGSDGGASILDLHSGALSLGKHFVNLYRYFGDKIQDIFTEEDFALYRDVRQRIQQRIAQAFGISSASMYLTKPTFFSRINNTEAKTTHDEYWHPHVDKVTYGSFDYTSLLYLSDYTEDFGGGRFVFMDEGSNKTIEPRAGRVSFFTSGSENLHRVEKVHWGTRYAITISFTCNPDHGIGDPVLM